MGFGSAILLGGTLLGCAPVAPLQTATSGGYPGTCELLSIEQVQGPAISQHDADTLWLVATYRLPERNAPAPPQRWSLRFRVERARARELRAHLEHHPRVFCQPEDDTLGVEPYELEVPPFEGQLGEPVPPMGAPER